MCSVEGSISTDDTTTTKAERTDDVRHDHAVEVVVGEGQPQGRSHDVLNVAHTLFLVVQTTTTNTVRHRSHARPEGVGRTWACLRAVSMERGEISRPIMR
jgi:hypothetical protein